jgi:hypothetical protein
MNYDARAGVNRRKQRGCSYDYNRCSDLALVVLSGTERGVERERRAKDAENQDKRDALAASSTHDSSRTIVQHVDYFTFSSTCVTLSPTLRHSCPPLFQGHQ